MLQLIKTQACKGICCRESARKWNIDHTNCVFNDGEGETRCAIMRGDAPMPDEPSEVFPDKTFEEVFEDTCVNWPHGEKNLRLGKTGGCCWQVVEV